MKSFLIKTAALFLAVIGSHSMKSQVACPFNVHNHLQCDLTLSIQFYDGTQPTCPPCGPPVVITAPANGVPVQVPCTCLPACSVDVTVIGIAGPCVKPYTSGTGTMGGPPTPLPGLPPCCGAGAGAHFIVHPAAVDIHP